MCLFSGRRSQNADEVGGLGLTLREVYGMALHPCPRCKQLIPVGIAYCDRCRPIAKAQAAEAIERRQAYKRAQYNKAYNKRTTYINILSKNTMLLTLYINTSRNHKRRGAKPLLLLQNHNKYRALPEFNISAIKFWNKNKFT